MIARYSRPAMASLWELPAKYERWLRVEILALEAWAKLGKVPADAVEEIRQKAQVDVERILVIEETVRHDVIAFTTQIAETVGPAAKYFHYGLTSSDVVDTAFALQLVEAMDRIVEEAQRLITLLRQRAREHAYTVMIGRTHGIHAEPTTLGLKFALFAAEMERNRERLLRAREVVAVGKLSGPVGTYSAIDPFVEEYVCGKLGLSPAPISTQVLQRDRHAEYMSALAITASTLDKIATEIRGLQRTEVREVEEPFREGQKGSSAMPHKRNPVGAEQASGLARVVRGHVATALENIPLWHERDISHSSAERIIFPDATILLDYLLAQMQTMIAGLHIYPERMRQNMALTGGLLFSQRVLLALVESGLSREDAYRIVQGHAMAAWNGGETFQARIRKDPAIGVRIPAEALDALFSEEPYLRHVETILSRLGIEVQREGDASESPRGDSR